MNNTSTRTQLEVYRGRVHEIQDDHFIVSSARLENSLKDMFEKGEQSVHTPSVSWVDAFVGAFVSSLVSAVAYFLCTADKTLVSIAVNIACPLLSLAGLIFFRQKRIIDARKQPSNTSLRDRCVSSELKSLHKLSNHR